MQLAFDRGDRAGQRNAQADCRVQHVDHEDAIEHAFDVDETVAPARKPRRATRAHRPSAHVEGRRHLHDVKDATLDTPAQRVRPDGSGRARARAHVPVSTRAGVRGAHPPCRVGVDVPNGARELGITTERIPRRIHKSSRVRFANLRGAGAVGATGFAEGSLHARTNMGANSALAQIGAESSFTVSYAIAAELRRAAVASGVAVYELIATVLLIAVALAAMPHLIHRGYATSKELWRRVRHSRPLPRFAERALDWVFDVSNATAKEAVDGPHSRSFIAFLEVLVGTGRRIAVALLVQVVAATAVAEQSLRLDRVLALLSVAVFFIFLQSGASSINT